jgi:thiamine-phosphate pyrophosphorylase
MRGTGAGKLYRLAERLRVMTHDYGALLIVNDRLDVALAVGADGLHLPADGMMPERARAVAGTDFLLGRSIHSLQEIVALRDQPLDYLQFGPIFETPSKARYGPPQGLEQLRQAVAAAGTRPIVAVGGMTSATAGSAMACGVAGVAVIGAIMHARHIGEATVALLETL